MVAETGERATPTLNTARIEALKTERSYFSERQVRVLAELGEYIQQRGEIPTTAKLSAFSRRSENEVRGDLMQVSLEGFLWVFGVES